VTTRALLVPDCGVGVGLGHLERMLALADALRPDVSTSVVLPPGDDVLHRRVADRDHHVVDATGDASGRALAAVEAGTDVVVLDGYGFDVTTQHRLRTVAPLVVVDDLAHPAFCDLAVNPSPGGEARRPMHADAFLGGAAYALVPGTVVAARGAECRVLEAGRIVLVSTGATDPSGLTEAVVAELLNRDPAVDVVAVVGPEMHPVGLPDDGRLSLLRQPATLAAALASATVFIGAAGTTAVQAACVGLPAVITPMVDNQRDQAAALAAAGCAICCPLQDLAAEGLRLLDDGPRRTAMTRAGRDLVDGRGAIRVAESLRRLVQAASPR
jgi:UDP-2,4-diacetamido-2,4,6-trideoxy-beta-L-altropyranose hydrolase